MWNLANWWNALKAWSFHSLTIAWSYLLMIGGTILANVDILASIVTDKQVSDQIAQAIGANPVIMGKWLAVVGVVTTIARIRGIVTKGATP